MHARVPRYADSNYGDIQNLIPLVHHFRKLISFRYVRAFGYRACNNFFVGKVDVLTMSRKTYGNDLWYTVQQKEQSTVTWDLLTPRPLKNNSKKLLSKGLHNNCVI